MADDLERQAAPDSDGGGLPPRAAALGRARDDGRDALIDLLSRWRDEARLRAVAQQLQAGEDARFNLIFGVAVTVFAAFGGSGILTSSSNSSLVMVAGWLSVLAAVIAGVQTSLRFGEKAGAHRGAAASFGGLRNRLDLALTRISRGREPTDDQLDDFCVQVEKLDTETPMVSDRLWRQARSRMGQSPRA